MSEYKLKFDLPDSRDYLYKKRSQMRLPSKIDLRPHCPPIENQGAIGSCTANALVGNLEFLELIETPRLEDLSRLFLYYNERFLDHDVTQDAGSTLREGIKALKKFGVCAESLWPYKPSLLFTKPSEEAYASALSHKISVYERLKTLDDMLDCLASGFPFVMGIQVYASFETQGVKETGIIPMPGPGEALLGGHALLAVGYDNAKECLIIRNSWGLSWGMKGYGWLPYNYIQPSLAQDFWTVRK